MRLVAPAVGTLPTTVVKAPESVVACHVWYQEVTEILLPAERHCIAARLCAQACRAAATAADGVF